MLSVIITSDLVPLSERGTYQGYLILAYSTASGVGPVIVSLTIHCEVLRPNELDREVHYPIRRRGGGFSVSDSLSAERRHGQLVFILSSQMQTSTSL